MADSVQRVKDIAIIKQIVYGNTSQYFGFKRESDNHTHDWCVYLRSYTHEDMSQYITKVQFKLHESYVNSTRICTKPPYEVRESGWGEFDIIIKIFFKDNVEKSVTVVHGLRLFQQSDEVPSMTPVVSECYDEVVFLDPTVGLHKLLVNCPKLRVVPYTHKYDYEEKKVRDIEVIKEANKKVLSEMKELTERIKSTKETIESLRMEIAN